MKTRIWIGATAAAGMMWGGTVQAGDLTPPGAPASTMKTLVDVEPRTPIYAVEVGFVLIDEPGSYYLAEDIPHRDNSIGRPSYYNISITASDVTLDLNGFSVMGGEAIDVIGISANNVTIMNGTVRGGTSYGIIGPDNITLRNVSVFDVVSVAIDLRDNAKIIDCTVKNGGSGITVRMNSLIQGCSVNGAFSGFAVEMNTVLTESGYLPANSVLRDTIVQGDGNSAISAVLTRPHVSILNCTLRDIPIATLGTCLIDGCTVSGAGIEVTYGPGSVIRNTSVTSPANTGIILSQSDGSLIEGCSVQNANSAAPFSTQYGIYIIQSDGVRLSDTVVSSTSTTDGIYVILGHNNAIVGCLVESSGGNGIAASSSTHMVVRDTEVADSGGYSIVANAESAILRNTFSGHGLGKAHVRLTDNKNVVDGNIMLDGAGFSVAGIDNRIFRNVMNGTQGSLNATTNDVAPVTTATAATSYYNNIN